MLKGMNNQSVRTYNAKLIIRLLFQYQQLSKSRLSRLLELSIPAISKILLFLEDRGWVEHVHTEHIGRGNSSGVYQISHKSSPIICIHITPSKISALVVNGKMELLLELREWHIAPAIPEELVQLVIKAYRQCANAAAVGKLKIALALHGQVDVHAGTSMFMPQAPWDSPIDFKYILEAELETQVAVDNDCVMLALAEKWTNPEHVRDFCVINVDYGIGSSFLIDDQIFRGPLYGSGQIGHSIIDQDGRKCGCGRYGCLETISSTKAMLADIRKQIKNRFSDELYQFDELEFEQAVQRYFENDPLVRRVCNKAASTLGISIYNFLVTMSVNDIVIYGEARKLGEQWLAQVKDQAHFNPFEDNVASVKEQKASIRFGDLSDTELLKGIGYLFIEKILEDF
ncbi:ROK family protein [Agarivorans sp. QJM3NY_29]|uniref:ROK family protein n=1 Tax=unclassified Agarivorans TaxID=2636026 RepID=UPI003D7C794A